MRKLLFAIAISISAISVTAQSGTNTVKALNKDSAAADSKFYFPIAIYSDSTAMARTMPKLADFVLANYKETNKRSYFEKCINYYLLSENYSKAIEMVDSIRKIDDDKSYDLDVTTYSAAKISEKDNKSSFEATFKSEFSKAFNELSFPKKVSLALIDSSAIVNLKKDYMSLQEKLIKNSKDSLTLEDASSLCDKYLMYTFNKKFVLLTDALIDKKYRTTFPAIKGVN